MAARKAIPIIALTLSALLGCAAESKILREDTTLTAEALREGGVAVLGVVKVEEIDTVRPPLIAKLEAVFAEERPDLPLIGIQRVRDALGKASYRRILLGYEYKGVIDTASLREIADSLRGLARYAVVARVESDRLRRSTRDAPEADTSRIGRAFGILVTGRNARVAVRLYDLDQRTVRLDARYAGTAESLRAGIASGARPPEPRMEVNMGSVRILPQEEGYPDPPALAEVVETPFRTFARSLPKSAP